jgi:hypothetical protein
MAFELTRAEVIVIVWLATGQPRCTDLTTLAEGEKVTLPSPCGPSGSRGLGISGAENATSGLFHLR